MHEYLIITSHSKFFLHWFTLPICSIKHFSSSLSLSVSAQIFHILFLTAECVLCIPAKTLACSLAENMSINLKQCRKLKLNAISWNWVQKVEFHWLTNKFLKYRKEKKERTDSVGESNNFSVQKSRVNKKNKSTQQGKNKYGMEAPNIFLEGKDKKDDWRDNRGSG